MSQFSSHHRPTLLFELRSAFACLPAFLMSPLTGPVRLPDLSWSALTSFIVLASVVTAAIAGIITGNLFRFWTSLILLPLASIVANSILVLVMILIIGLFSGRTLDWRKIAGLAALSSVVYLIGSLISLAWAPALFVGFTLQTLVFGSALIQRHHVERAVVWSTVLGLNFAFVGVSQGWVGRLLGLST
jgi:hypothetical protein